MKFPDIGRSTIYFTNASEMTRVMVGEDFLQTLTAMQCLLAIMKSDNFKEIIDLIDLYDKMPTLPFKNKKKYFLAFTPKMDHDLLLNKSYNFNTYFINTLEKGETKGCKAYLYSIG